jgi:hypothetical protein
VGDLIQVRPLALLPRPLGPAPSTLSLLAITIRATSAPNRCSISSRAASPPPSSTASCSSAPIASSSEVSISSAIAATASRWAT